MVGRNPRSPRTCASHPTKRSGPIQLIDEIETETITQSEVDDVMVTGRSPEETQDETRIGRRLTNGWGLLTGWEPFP